MRKLKDISGIRSGRIEAVRLIRVEPKTGAIWEAKCDCGTVKEIAGYILSAKMVASCGCLRKERNVKHGHSRRAGRSPTYETWVGMLNRCRNPTHKDYSSYGGKGVSVCARWEHGTDRSSGFQCFVEDMGERPAAHTLDRIYVNGDYSADNCRWATAQVQAQNKANTVRVEGKTLREIAAESGIALALIRSRYYQGKCTIKALTDGQRMDGTVVDRRTGEVL